MALLNRLGIQRDVALGGDNLLPLAGEQEAEELRRRTTQRTMRWSVHTDREVPDQRVGTGLDVLVGR